MCFVNLVTVKNSKTIVLYEYDWINWNILYFRMEKELNIISFDYLEVKKTSLFFKVVSILLMIMFISVPLYDLVDVFRRDLIYPICCLLSPCPSPFYSYYFI